MNRPKPVEVVYNDGTIKEYPSIRIAAKSLDVSEGYIQSFLQKRRPKEIIDIRKIDSK